MEHAARDSSFRDSVLRRKALVAGALSLLVAALAVWVLVARSSDDASRLGKVLAPAAFEEQTGIRVVRVSIGAGGGLIDIRYQVLDPDKAVVVHDQKNPPAVVDEETGQVLGESWHTHPNRQTLRAGGTYYFLLLNEGRVVAPGGIVSVKIGGARLENVTVQ